MARTSFEVVIVGGGVSGAALLYELALHGGLKRVALVEKGERLAALNSHASANSQTLHAGDLETNYSLGKARKVRDAAAKVLAFLEHEPQRDRILGSFPKMLLGVGEVEVALLRARFEALRELYPHLRLMERAEIAAAEPAVVEGRAPGEALLALGAPDQPCAVDFGELARAFVARACRAPGRHVEVLLGHKVLEIFKGEAGFTLRTPFGELHAGAVVVSAGAHSLRLAQAMGYGMDYSILPVAGSFYHSPEVLRGKVYTVQQEQLPFAAVHGDPDLLCPGITRWGPTALPLAKLERYRSGTFGDFLATLHPGVAKVLLDFAKHPEVRRYMIHNALCEVPLLRRHLFVRDVRKIAPALRAQDLCFAAGVGGVRPQVVDRAKGELLMGEARIDSGCGILFNLTPSPGATACLANAEADARLVLDWLGR